MNLKNLLIFALASLVLIGCKPKFDSEITLIEIHESMEFLAGDSLKGRYPGSAEDLVLLSFITNSMDDAGLRLPYDEGKQELFVSKGFKEGASNQISYDGNILNSSESTDFDVLGFSSTDTVEAEIVMANSLPEDGSTIQEKILVLLLPSDLPANPYDAYNALRTQSLKAADLGIAGLIYIFNDSLPKLENDKRASLQIPVAAINSAVIPETFNYENVLAILSGMPEGAILATGTDLRLSTEILSTKLTTYNSVAHLQGSNDSLAGEYIIIGGHHDHLGMGGRGSSSRRQDTIAIHYGADDNASGTIGVMELAENMTQRAPERSFVFTTFAAEEMGLWGSKYYAENPSIDLSNAQAMINIDMIGRLNEERQLQIGGVGTSPIFRALLDTINLKYNFNIAYSEAGFGPSDHSSFYAKDVPVLFFSTGAHTDYHTPFDTYDKINYEGMVEVLNFVSDVAYELANMPEKIEFTLAGPKKSSGSRGRAGMVTFGLMPDVVYDGNEGMPVSFVTEGKPAAIGGMKGKDIIIAVDGKRVGNIQDYMDRLTELKEGQSVIVEIIRDGDTIELLLKL